MQEVCVSTKGNLLFSSKSELMSVLCSQFSGLCIFQGRGVMMRKIFHQILSFTCFYLKMSYSEQCDACFRSDSVTRVICFWDGWTHIFSPDGDTRPQFSDDGIGGKIIFLFIPCYFSPTWQFSCSFPSSCTNQKEKNIWIIQQDESYFHPLITFLISIFLFYLYLRISIRLSISW